MNKHSAEFWLRVSYWTGAIVDGFAAMAMLFPKLTKFFLGFEPIPDPAYRFAISMVAALMLGWTVLLLWADQDPLARKGVLCGKVVRRVGSNHAREHHQRQRQDHSRQDAHGGRREAQGT